MIVGSSATVTSKNAEVVSSDEFVDRMIQLGFLYTDVLSLYARTARAIFPSSSHRNNVTASSTKRFISSMISAGQLRQLCFLAATSISFRSSYDSRISLRVTSEITHPLFRLFTTSPSLAQDYDGLPHWRTTDAHGCRELAFDQPFSWLELSMDNQILQEVVCLNLVIGFLETPFQTDQASPSPFRFIPTACSMLSTACIM